jgi:hypothetical protein
MTLSGYEPNLREDKWDASVMEEYQDTTKLVISTCISIKKTYLLFGEIWDRYFDAHLDGVHTHTTLSLSNPRSVFEFYRNSSSMKVLWYQTPS